MSTSTKAVFLKPVVTSKGLIRISPFVGMVNTEKFNTAQNYTMPFTKNLDDKGKNKACILFRISASKYDDDNITRDT